MTTIAIAILDELDRHGGEIHGTEHLAYDLLNCDNKSHVLSLLRRAEEQGDVIIIQSAGGRGRKTIIRKRNRNSPGQPRRKPRGR